MILAETFTVEFKPFHATTPSLDFKIDSEELETTINKLYLYKQQLLSLPKDQQTQNGQSILVSLVFKVLCRFNIVTRPPTKSKKPQTEELPIPIDTNEHDLSKISVHNFDPTLSNHQKAKYHFLRGRLLNIFESYNYKAEEDLSIAVKLNPRNFKAWTELGECFWKKGDLEAAEECFKWILRVEREKQALTNLAMVQRRAKKDRETLENSIKLCKEALALDLSFSDAWVGIGSSYMAIYFNVSRDLKDLKLALSAYEKADTNSKNPDLFQSKAIIHEYFENYDKAIENFLKASSLDSNLDSTVMINSIKMFVSEMTRAIESKLNMNEESIQKSAAKLKLQDAIRNEVELKDSNSFKASSTIQLLVMCIAKRYHDAVGNSYIGLDKNGQFCGITVLNLKSGIITKGDMLQITGPVIIRFGEKKLPLIRVDSPYQAVVNGSRISSDQTAWVEMLVDTKTT